MIRPYTEDHLVEQPAIQLMQHELGWEGARNFEHRTLNMERRREEMKMNRTKPALLRLNPDLPMEAIDGAEGEEILNGRGRRVKCPPSDPAGVSVFSLISPGGEIRCFAEIESNFTGLAFS